MSGMIGNGFIRRVEEEVPFYSCLALERLEFVRHGFSTRQGGVSNPGGGLNLSHTAWDLAENVERNRRRFLSALNLPPEFLVTVAQTHSDICHIISPDIRRWDRRTAGDALATVLENAALAVQVADCLPILLADPRTKVVAAVHAGWRGTLNRILLKTVQSIRRAFGCDPAGLLAAVGPGIRSCCMEVGPEVIDSFEREYRGASLFRASPWKRGKYLLDLAAALGIQFSEAGIPSGNVFDLGSCTRCDTGQFYSYRAEGVRSGRMMALICRVGNE